MRNTHTSLLAAAFVAMALTLSACGSAPAQEPEPTTIVEGTPVLFFFDDAGATQLREDMEAGNVPLSCTVLYDESGCRPEVTVTDPETIAELYDRFSQMIVLEDGKAMGVTDSYHYIAFTLQDGTTVSWGFEGAGAICDGSDLLAVSDEGGLWQLVRELQEPLMDDGE